MGEAIARPPIRVMLVEDNAAVRRAVTAVLSAAGGVLVCAEAATVADAAIAAEESQPDVVIVDLRLPDGSGVDAGRRVRASCPGARLLLLTSASEEEATTAAVLAGASGFLLKQLVGADIVAAVRSLAEGKTLLAPAAAASAVEQASRLTVGGADDGRLASSQRDNVPARWGRSALWGRLPVPFNDHINA